MSFFGNVGNFLSKVAKPVVNAVRTVAKLPGVSMIPGIGQVAGVINAVDTFNTAVIRPATAPALKAVNQVRTAVAVSARQAAAMPQLQAVNLVQRGVSTMSAQGARSNVAQNGVAYQAGRTVGRAVRRYAGAGWVQNILAAGGTIVAGMVYDAANRPIGPAPKRKRSKGITARELKSFTRVTGILSKYCKTPPPRRRAAPARGKSCR